MPALQSNWLLYHVITCFLGYAAFAVACGISIMYLIKARAEGDASDASAGGVISMFPSIRVLDDLNYKAIMIGCVSMIRPASDAVNPGTNCK